MGHNILGVEIDLADSPDFFNRGGPLELVSKSNVTTLMFNVIVGMPIGVAPGVQPYVSGGGGLMAFLGDHVGLRGDARYFRSSVKPAE